MKDRQPILLQGTIEYKWLMINRSLCSTLAENPEWEINEIAKNLLSINIISVQ
jgi:hypothetical protein